MRKSTDKTSVSSKQKKAAVANTQNAMSFIASQDQSVQDVSVQYGRGSIAQQQFDTKSYQNTMLPVQHAPSYDNFLPVGNQQSIAPNSKRPLSPRDQLGPSP